MAEKLSEVYVENPITTLPDDGLLYIAKTPYGVASSQCAIKSQDIFPASGTVVDGDIALFNGTSGKKIKKMATLLTGQVAGGTTGTNPKPYTLTAGTNISSISTDTKASTITINASTQTVTFPTLTEVYFSNYGADITPSPYSPISPAASFAYLHGKILDANEFKVYSVYRQSNVQELSQVELGPWANIIGEDSNTQWILPDSLIIKASLWTSANTNLSIQNHILTSATSDVITFDFTTTGTTNCIVNLSDLKTFGKNISVIGKAGVTLNIENVNQSISASGAGSSSLTITNCNVRMKNTINNTVTMNFTGSDSYVVTVNNDKSYNGVTINGTALINFTIINSPDTALSLNGAGLTSRYDVQSGSNVTLGGGVSYPVLITSGEGLDAAYTPSNYTPINTSVTGHLQGINNALGGATFKNIFVEGYEAIWSDVFTGHELTLTPGKIFDSTGQYLITSAFDIIIDVTVSGIGGLNTGLSYTTSTWLHAYLAYDTTGSNFVQGFFDTSDTPTPPAGYDKYAYVWSMRTFTVGTGLLGGFQRGKGKERRWYWNNADVALTVLADQKSTSLADVDCSSAVSSRGEEILGFEYLFYPGNPGGSNVNNFELRSTLSGSPPYVSPTTGTNNVTSEYIRLTTPPMPLDVDKKIQYKLAFNTDSAQLTLQCLGYIQSIGESL